MFVCALRRAHTRTIMATRHLTVWEVVSTRGKSLSSSVGTALWLNGAIYREATEVIKVTEGIHKLTSNFILFDLKVDVKIIDLIVVW